MRYMLPFLFSLLEQVKTWKYIQQKHICWTSLISCFKRHRISYIKIFSICTHTVQLESLRAWFLYVCKSWRRWKKNWYDVWRMLYTKSFIFVFIDAKWMFFLSHVQRFLNSTKCVQMYAVGIHNKFWSMFDNRFWQCIPYMKFWIEWQSLIGLHMFNIIYEWTERKRIDANRHLNQHT